MLWNKIKVDDFKITLKDNNPYYIKIDDFKELDIIVSENVSSKIVILGNSDYNINIFVHCNGSLIVNSLNRNNNVNVCINLKENCSIIYNHSVLNSQKSDNHFIINHLNNNSVSILNNNGINISSNKLFFTIDGIINKNLKNISCNQNSKIINFENGNSKIIPNLIIDSNDVIANHSAYIGKIDDEEMFYMASRGMNVIDIKKLLYKSVLLGKMELLEEEEEFNKIVNEWW